MTKYVTHKNGLIIGSDNIFFIKDETNGYRQYNCIVWPLSYTFDQYNAINLNIKTPAEQVVWYYNEQTERWELGPYINKWLTNNVGQILKDWDWRQNAKTSHDLMLFFRKRNDGIKFINYVNQLLKGMKLDK